MKKKKNSEINWEEKIVRDLGSDKYNELFTSTNEEIKFYTDIFEQILETSKKWLWPIRNVRFL